MKRTPSLIVFASLILALGLVSCDAMFENNLFAGMTHKELTVDSIQTQSPSELKETLDSQVYMDQLAEDQELKDAALGTLESAYTAPGATDTAEGQTAAILAADIMIDTVPAAAQFTASIVGIITDVETLGDNPENMAETLQGILPLSIQESLTGGQTEPPADFVAMIDAFLAANDAYQALGAGLDGGDYVADVSDGEALDIAVNAVICGAIWLISPVDVEMSTAEALWSAMLDPASAGDVIGIGDFDGMIDPEGGGSIGNLLHAAGIDFCSGE